jgi:hypothetical protein
MEALVPEDEALVPEDRVRTVCAGMGSRTGQTGQR